VIVKAAPQLLLTAGGEGTVCAFEIHATVEAPPAGKEKVGALIV
jgi:hypothetical protein